MQVDKRFESMLKKKVELERLRVEHESISDWHSRLTSALTKANDYKSLETNIKLVLKGMNSRLSMVESQIKDLQ